MWKGRAYSLTMALLIGIVSNQLTIIGLWVLLGVCRRIVRDPDKNGLSHRRVCYQNWIVQRAAAQRGHRFQGQDWRQCTHQVRDQFVLFPVRLQRVEAGSQWLLPQDTPRHDHCNEQLQPQGSQPRLPTVVLYCCCCCYIPCCSIDCCLHCTYHTLRLGFSS